VDDEQNPVNGFLRRYSLGSNDPFEVIGSDYLMPASS
jgi:hypothetical protein